MSLDFKPRGSEIVDWKPTLPFVIPAQAGIQVFLAWQKRAKMDAGLRRHDKSSLRQKPSPRFLEGGEGFQPSPRGTLNLRIFLTWN
jgi:hypothetical protein